MNPQQPPAPPIQPGSAPPSGDLRVLLIIFGILFCMSGVGSVFGGLYTALFPLMMELSMMDATSSGGLAGPEEAFVQNIFESMGDLMWMAAILYFALGVVEFWLGIGSCLCKRWAAKIILAFGWIWTLSMLVGFLIILTLIPEVLNTIDHISAQAAASAPPGSPPPSIPTGGIVAGFVIYFAIIMAFYAIPGVILIIVYNLRNVRVTCYHRDPVERWTDNVPLPVLIAWIGIVGMAVTVTLFAPFYGGWLDGLFMFQADPPAIVGFIAIAIGVVLGFSAWQLMKMKVLGVWLALAAVCVAMSGGVLYFSEIDFIKMFEFVELPPKEMDEVKKIMPEGFSILLPVITYATIAIGYLLYLLVFFRQSPNEEASA